MSPFSAPVLVGAAVVSSPALWNALHGIAPAEVALTRYLVSVLLCWLALAAVSFIVGPMPRSAQAGQDLASDADAATEQVPAT